MMYRARVSFMTRVPVLESDAGLNEGMDRLAIKDRAVRRIYDGVAKQLPEPWWRTMCGNPWRQVWDTVRPGRGRR